MTGAESDRPCRHWGSQSESESGRLTSRPPQCLVWAEHLKVYTLFNFKI